MAAAAYSYKSSLRIPSQFIQEISLSVLTFVWKAAKPCLLRDVPVVWWQAIIMMDNNGHNAGEGTERSSCWFRGVGAFWTPQLCTSAVVWIPNLSLLCPKYSMEFSNNAYLLAMSCNPGCCWRLQTSSGLCQCFSSVVPVICISSIYHITCVCHAGFVHVHLTLQKGGPVVHACLENHHFFVEVDHWWAPFWIHLDSILRGSYNNNNGYCSKKYWPSSGLQNYYRKEPNLISL